MAIVSGKLGIQKLVTQTQSLGEFDKYLREAYGNC